MCRRLQGTVGFVGAFWHREGSYPRTTEQLHSAFILENNNLANVLHRFFHSGEWVIKIKILNFIFLLLFSFSLAPGYYRTPVSWLSAHISLRETQTRLKIVLEFVCIRISLWYFLSDMLHFIICTLSHCTISPNSPQ